MPIKYVDETTGELIQKVLDEQTGAPSAYGIKTMEQLIETSRTSEKMNYAENIFFNKRAKLWRWIARSWPMAIFIYEFQYDVTGHKLMTKASLWKPKVKNK